MPRKVVPASAGDKGFDLTGMTVDDQNPELQKKLVDGSNEFFKKNNPGLYAVMQKAKKQKGV